MYAITFDLDTNCINENYSQGTYNNAYNDVRKFLLENGFKWKQGSVYFGDKDMDAVSCVVVVQKLGRKYTWFRDCVKDIRMLKIEEDNNLKPALDNI